MGATAPLLMALPLKNVAFLYDYCVGIHYVFE